MQQVVDDFAESTRALMFLLLLLLRALKLQRQSLSPGRLFLVQTQQVSQGSVVSSQTSLKVVQYQLKKDMGDNCNK